MADVALPLLPPPGGGRAASGLRRHTGRTRPWRHPLGRAASRGGGLGVRPPGPYVIETPAGGLAGWSLGMPGRGPTAILFIHPINLQGACWLAVAKALEPERFSVMPDLRGHGRSFASGPFSLDAWTDDCVASMDRFELNEVHVVGGSLAWPARRSARGPSSRPSPVDHRHRQRAEVSQAITPRACSASCARKV